MGRASSAVLLAAVVKRSMSDVVDGVVSVNLCYRRGRLQRKMSKIGYSQR